jgi:hypothetical protein
MKKGTYDLVLEFVTFTQDKVTRIACGFASFPTATFVVAEI